MHISLRIAGFGLALALGSAHAADDAKAKAAPAGSSQQSRMKDCSADAKSQGLKGDERRAFMSTCLKKKDKSA